MKELWNSYHWQLIGALILFWVITKTSAGSVLGSLPGYIGKGRTVSWKRRIKDWMENSTVQLWLMWMFLMLILIPVLILSDEVKVPYSTSPQGLWWGLLFSGNGLLLVLGLSLFGYIMPANPKKPFKDKLSRFGMQVTAVVVFFYIWGTFSQRVFQGVELGGVTSSLSSLSSSVTKGVKGALESKVSPYFRGQYTFQNEAVRFWYGNIPSRDAWDMVDTIKLESGFQHFNRDGSVLRGQVNPRDIGLHQINLDESKYEIEEAGCNVEDLDCNFKVALLVYRKHGLGRWVAYEQVKNMPVSLKVIQVPVGSWSEVYRVAPGSNCHWTIDRPMTIRSFTGELYEATPEKFPPIDSPTQQFTIESGEPGKVEVRCR